MMFFSALFLLAANADTWTGTKILDCQFTYAKHSARIVGELESGVKIRPGILFTVDRDQVRHFSTRQISKISYDGHLLEIEADAKNENDRDGKLQVHMGAKSDKANQVLWTGKGEAVEAHPSIESCKVVTPDEFVQ